MGVWIRACMYACHSWSACAVVYHLSSKPARRHWEWGWGKLSLGVSQQPGVRWEFQHKAGWRGLLCLFCLIQKQIYIQRPRYYSANPINVCLGCLDKRHLEMSGQGHCVRQRKNEKSETVLLCKAAVTWLWLGSLPWHVGTVLLALFHTVLWKYSVAEAPHKHLNDGLSTLLNQQ